RLADLEPGPTSGAGSPRTDSDAATDDVWAAATDHDERPGETPPTATGEQAVSRVRVQASGRPVRVVADPTVATVTVEGPHNVRRDGTTLVVDAPVAGASDPEGSYRYERKTGLARWISQATLVGIPLTLRVNPDLELDLEVLAGSLAVSGSHGPLRF